MDPSDDAGDQVAQLEPVLRRLLVRRAPPGAVDDLVQDALERVLAARQRLAPGSLLAYSIVVARSVLVNELRATERHRRLEPSLADHRQPDLPEASVEADDEHEAIRVALKWLSDVDRDALIRHDIGGAGLAELAHDAGSTPGAIATRLSRARAHLRVEYVLAIRRVRLPTAACHPVLLALSAGDKRRQRRLAAAAHLLACPPCAELAPALVERRRHLAAVIPLGAGVARPRRWLSQHPKSATAAAAAVILVAAALALARPGPAPTRPLAAPPTPAPPCPELRVGGGPAPAAFSELAGRAGQPAAGSQVLVDAVPADEGFWIRCGPLRLWVQSVGAGESPATIRPGKHVSFTGTLVAHGDDYPSRVGVAPAEGAAELAQDKVHVEARRETIAIT